MKTRAFCAALLVLLSLCPAVPAAQPMPKDLQALIETVPADYPLVLGVADMKQAIGDLRAWSDPIIAQAPPEAVQKYNAALKALADIFPGPVVIAAADFANETPPLLLASVTATQAEIKRRIEALGIKVEERGDLLMLMPGTLVWATVRGGRLVASTDEQALRHFLAAPPDKARSVLSAPGMDKLLESEEVASASLFLCCAQPNVLVEKMLPQAPPGEMGRGQQSAINAVQRRLLAAFGFDLKKPAPAALYLKATNEEIRLGGFLVTATDAKEGPKPAVDLARLPLNLSKGAAACAYGWKTPSFAAFVDDIAAGMRRFDPDVGDEFLEKMGELDRDLGYNFQKDFLALLGPEWMCVTIADRADAPWQSTTQVFVCSLKDREAFIARAANLAAISHAPWEHRPDFAGAWRIKTAILTYPAELAVRENALLISASEKVLEKALQPELWTRTAEGAMRATVAAAKLVVSANVPALASISAGPEATPAPFLAPLKKLPAATTLTFTSEQFAGRARIEIALTGLTPKAVNAILAVGAEALAGPREEAHRAACMGNLAQVTKALVVYQNDHKDAMPAKLADLTPKYIAERSFQCPSAQAAGKPTPHYGYVFIPAEDVAEMGVNTVIVYDNEDNHEGGRNAGFLDSHVKWLSEPEFQTALKATMGDLAKAKAAREAKGAPK